MVLVSQKRVKMILVVIPVKSASPRFTSLQRRFYLQLYQSVFGVTSEWGGGALRRMQFCSVLLAKLFQ